MKKGVAARAKTARLYRGVAEKTPKVALHPSMQAAVLSDLLKRDGESVVFTSFTVEGKCVLDEVEVRGGEARIKAKCGKGGTHVLSGKSMEADYAAFKALCLLQAHDPRVQMVVNGSDWKEATSVLLLAKKGRDEWCDCLDVISRRCLEQLLRAEREAARLQEHYSTMQLIGRIDTDEQFEEALRESMRLLSGSLDSHTDRPASREKARDAEGGEPDRHRRDDQSTGDGRDPPRCP